MLRDIASGGGGCWRGLLSGGCEQAGLWGLPNHLKPLQSCLALNEFPCICCWKHSTEHLHGQSMGGQSKTSPGLRQGGCSRSWRSCFHVKYLYFWVFIYFPHLWTVYSTTGFGPGAALHPTMGYLPLEEPPQGEADFPASSWQCFQSRALKQQRFHQPSAMKYCIILL